MKSDSSTRLSADGFERVATWPVGVAHFVWRVDLDLEFDRELRLVEETILRLVAAGVGEPDRVAGLMGLDDGRIVPTTIVDLLRKGLIFHQDGRLYISPRGTEAVHRAQTRETHTYTGVELRHDPYRDELKWTFDENEFKREQLGAAGLRALPQPGELSPAELEGRYREIQALLELEGLPFENEEERKVSKKRRREVLRVRPLKCYVAYREAELEAWYRPERDEWQWRLLRSGGEETEVSARLAELESNGTVIIPLEERREITVTQQGEAVHAAAEEAQRTVEPALLETHQHRDALRDAILDARKELVIISPWLRTDAVDEELIGWLRMAFERHKELRIVIGYGIERNAGKQQDRATRDQEEALKRLHKLAERWRGRLRIIEIGNTHEKVVICDDRYVIITSFNFLSFKPRPGKGIRREMGSRITDRDTVTKVKAKITAALLASTRERT
jgi:hypothetical protein